MGVPGIVDSVPGGPRVSIPAPLPRHTFHVYVDGHTYEEACQTGLVFEPAALAVTILKPSTCWVHWGLQDGRMIRWRFCLRMPAVCLDL